ncbi:HaeIII family restriction endonuclease [Mesomycoplasma hyorhinis]|uniref:HaeIII family restriction endonuclease n=1 Tax=Mesomycoplasma hyorhinis TaxID=2100 RepID=UPI001C03EE07|nr:HaeIII family restriction endonuclease [Mesomycoplasma hyorhinis]
MKKSIWSVEKIIELEDSFFKKEDFLIKLQKDFVGEKGDVRDIIIKSSKSNREIGISIKHNNYSIKHSCISQNSIFCINWFNNKCSETYTKEIEEFFKNIELKKSIYIKWNQIPKIEKNSLYVQLLEIFKSEIIRQFLLNNSILRHLLEYLIGKNNFYKCIVFKNKSIVQFFNLKEIYESSLDQKNTIYKDFFPTKILNFHLKENSNNTLILSLNNNWSFSFRIHNASSEIQKSLKFDIKLLTMPEKIMSIFILH